MSATGSGIPGQPAHHQSGKIAYTELEKREIEKLRAEGKYTGADKSNIPKNSTEPEPISFGGTAVADFSFSLAISPGSPRSPFSMFLTSSA